MPLSSKGCVATLWKVEHLDKYTKAQISTSKLNEQTNKWETDFSAFAFFVGRARNVVKDLKEKDRVKITEFSVTTSYSKEKNTNYTNFTVWDCEIHNAKQSESKPKGTDAVDDMFVEEDEGSDMNPF